MSSIWYKLQNIPRWAISVLCIIVVVVPMLFPMNLSFPIDQDVTDFVNFINNLPEGSVVVFGFDSDTWQWVRTAGAAVGTLNLLFQRPVKVLIWSTQAAGLAFWPALLSRITIPPEKKYGVDWMYYGFISGDETALAQLAVDMRYPRKDYKGTLLSELPVMEGIKDHSNVDLLIQSGASGEWPKYYLRQWAVPYGVPLALCQTAGNTLMNISFRAAGQIQWLIWANYGGAMLESILGYSGWGMASANAYNMITLLMIGLVVIGNIGYWMEKTKKEET